MSNRFIDDKMDYIESDIGKIQAKTGMYISYVGEKGALHLAKEIIQNAVDEVENSKSPAKTINLKLDILSDTLSVEDDGRGIPEDDFPMDILCTKLQSGSKFTREQGGKSAGENGVGLTATNALSEIFEFSSYRSGIEHTIKFTEGKKTDDNKKKSKKEHGTIVKFSPGKKYLGKSAKIPKNGLITWVESISYFIPSKCVITLEIYKGLELIDKFKYKQKSIVELLKSKISDEVLSPYFNFSNETKLYEDFRGERKIKRDLMIQFTFVYTTSIEPWIDSYCNYINTTSGGVHLNTVRESIWRYLMKKTNETLSEKEKEKYKVLKVDIEEGLNIIVNMSTDMQMQLVGQTKNEVSNDQLVDSIKDLTNDCLDKYFNENKLQLSQLVKIVKTNCKARIDASKIKSATIKETVNKFDKHKFDKFTPCNNDGKAYKELHLCEGDSAANGMIDGRDPDTQSFLAFRGVTANGFKRDASTILDNAEWRTYVTLLKTNFGPKFDLSKCYYDKIIIESDSDIDGYGITSGIGAFHALYMPELVKDGRLYKSIAPLYHIDDKKTPFVRDKREYISLYHSKVYNNYKVKLVIDGKDSKPLNTKEFEDFIYDTQEYSDELIRISKHFGVNKFLIEIVAAYIIMKHSGTDMDKLFADNKFVISFMEVIQHKFPEIQLKGKHSLRGVISGKFQSININNRFVKKTSDLLNVYLKYGYSLLVKEKNDDYREMSIGEFLDNANKFKPRIITRYKGLGEANSKQLWDTTLNPDTRILIQLTMDDVEKDLAIFGKLHGQSKKNLEDRKKMMSSYKIKREDLDN